MTAARATAVRMVCFHLFSRVPAAWENALPLMERGARDERNFVKKGVIWARVARRAN